MSEPQLEEITLFQDPHCPYSERARRALSEKGVYQNRVNVGWHEREDLKQKTGHDTTPVALYQGRILAGSGEIARFANAMVKEGIDLFPDGLTADIEKWERWADELAESTMPLVTPIWSMAIRDAKEREGFVRRTARYGDIKALRPRQLEFWNQVMARWREINDGLNDRDYLLGTLTYADYAVYGSVYLAAQFHAFDVPEALANLAAWYETIRTAGIMRDQEVLLSKSRRGHKTHDIDYTRRATRYGDPPHRPAQSNDKTF